MRSGERHINQDQLNTNQVGQAILESRRLLLDEHETPGLSGVVVSDDGKKYIECDVVGIGLVRVKPKNVDPSLKLVPGKEVAFDLFVRLYSQGDPVYLAKNVTSFQRGPGRRRGTTNSGKPYKVKRRPGRTHGQQK